jgi:hypothetical protein
MNIAPRMLTGSRGFYISGRRTMKYFLYISGQFRAKLSLYRRFWIGAIVGRDTLVSVGIDDYYSVAELWPDPEPKGLITRRSIQSSNQFYSSQAISEQDIIAVYKA